MNWWWLLRIPCYCKKFEYGPLLFVYIVPDKVKEEFPFDYGPLYIYIVPENVKEEFTVWI